MALSFIKKEWEASHLQLSLNFTSSPSHSEKIKIADRRIHAIAKSSIVFHEEGSSITNNTFVLKIWYKNRSYELSWVYRKERVRSFSDAEFSDILIHMHPFTSIFAFRNGRYDDIIPISDRDYEKFMKYARSILENPRYNETLAIRNEW